MFSISIRKIKNQPRNINANKLNDDDRLLTKLIMNFQLDLSDSHANYKNYFYCTK